MAHRNRALRHIETNSHSHQFMASLLSLPKKLNTHVFLSLSVGGPSLFESADGRFSGSRMPRVDLVKLLGLGLLRSEFVEEVLDPVFPCC